MIGQWTKFIFGQAKTPNINESHCRCLLIHLYTSSSKEYYNIV